MIREILVAAFSALTIFGCQSAPPPSKPLPVVVADEATQGSSAATAIKLPDAKDEISGIRAERNWIQQHYPGARPKSQALLMGPPAMDLIEIQLPTGEIRKIYFDISSFFHF